MGLPASLRLAVAAVVLSACSLDVHIDRPDVVAIDAVDAAPDVVDVAPDVVDVSQAPRLVGAWVDANALGGSQETITFLADGAFRDVTTYIYCSGDITITGAWSTASTTLLRSDMICDSSVVCTGFAPMCSPPDAAVTVHGLGYTLSADGDTLTLTQSIGNGEVVSQVLTRVE